MPARTTAPKKTTRKPPAAERPLASTRPSNTSPQLIVILGDQLDASSAALQNADPARDTIVMMEVLEESTHVPSHRARTVLFLSAMRHFAASLREQGFTVIYSFLTDPLNTHSFATELPRLIAQHARLAACDSISLVHPGEHRVAAIARAWQSSTSKPVELLEDQHFLTTPQQFADWALGRKELTMEYFYREQRKRLRVLMEADNKTPLSGTWNYDRDNRQSFGKTGPKPRPPKPKAFALDAITRDTIADVRRMLPDAPGSDADLEHFSWPVTREQALDALQDFIKHRLALFGPYEDAMWTNEPVVYHSALSSAINLKLLHPRECVEAALEALVKNKAPLQSVEALIRQLIGWREFIRGVYWLEGETYAHRNWLNQHGKLPSLYWSGETDMACLRECTSQVVKSAYSHHIQRLMVLGNFALTSGVHPRAISDWFLAMYVDAIDWVTLPNTLGMVMHADGVRDGPNAKRPVVGTKPYCSSGQYISKMSNYCTSCKHDPANRGDDPATRDRACPFSVFYWDFLHRNRASFAKNPRMTTILPNLDRFGEAKLTNITISAQRLREKLGIGTINPPT
jgi:deoxyribodipyrimidine photolyase-related protein